MKFGDKIKINKYRGIYVREHLKRKHSLIILDMQTKPIVVHDDSLESGW